jgi:nitrate reductase gamma subunit
MFRFTFLWVSVLVAIAIFLVGLYKNVVSKIAYIMWVNTPGREEDIYRDARVRLPFPRIRTLIDEALLQKRIRNRSAFLWIRHMLIFFGFGVLFLFDQLTYFLGKLGHRFAHVEYFTTGPGRAFLKFGLELSGGVLFLGITLALIHRIAYAKEEKDCVDLPLILLLWAVVLSGFLAESFRFVVEPMDPFLRYSFLAGPLARALAALSWPWQSLAWCMWMAHVSSVLFFFAYVPYSRLVHMFVSPIGRSLTMGQNTAQRKMEKISEGWL